MPSGVYLPCGDLCDFVGCPLNGIWTFNVIDQWAADNGTLFNWGIDFNPEIVPGVTTFTPIIGLGADSSYWHPVGDLDNVLNTSDLGVVGVSDDANYVDLMFPDPGTFEFGYVVTNNFGCTWDTTLVVEVIENPGTFITAGPDQIFCSNPVTLLGAIDDGGVSACGGDAGSFEICLGNGENVTYTYCPDNPGDGTMMSLNFTGGFLETCCDFMSVYDGPDDTAPLIVTTNGDFTGVDFMATNPSGCLTIVLTSDGSVSCGSGSFDPLAFCATCAGSGDVCSYDWLWEPAEYLDDNTLAQPTVIDFDGAPIEFTLYVEPVGFDNCQATDVVTVGPGFDFDVAFQQPSCFANDGIIDVEIFEDANDAAGPFTIQLFVDGPGGVDLIEELVWDNLTDFYYNDLVPGDYTVVVFDNEGCIYNFPIVLEDPLPLTLDIPNIQTICLGGTANLTVSSPQDPLNIWTYQWNNGLPNGPVQQVSPNTSTVYTVQGFDPNGCPTDEYQVGVNVLSPINADLVGSDFLCSGEEAYLDASASNGGSGTGYTYTWSFEGNILSEDEESIWTIPPSTGEYCVTVNDDCETPAATVCTDVVLESPVPIAFSADTTEACGQGTFLFTNETDPALITSSLWAFGDGTYAGESNTVKTFQSPGFYDVSLTVTSAAGGCEYTQVEEAYINVYPIPQVGFFAGPQPTRAPETTIDFDGYSNASVVEWFWTFNTYNPLGYSFEQDPTFQFPVAEGGIYPVQLQITDSHGCINVVNRQIEIQGMFNLFIPTSFTPNNDGHNDAFFVEGTDIDPDRFEFEIWNRWGELIWSTTDPTDAWYGQVGEEGQHYVPNGPYMYRIEVHSLEEESYRKEVFGVVTIIR
jgi:gliding motility-associated-like protein